MGGVPRSSLGRPSQALRFPEIDQSTQPGPGSMCYRFWRADTLDATACSKVRQKLNVHLLLEELERAQEKHQT